MTEIFFNINDLFFNTVTYKYIPKMDNKIGIDNVNFIAELKTIEKANSFKYFIFGINSLYFYLLLEQKFLFFSRIKPLMILLLPAGFYSYGLYKSRSEITKILQPLFQEEFLLYKAGVNKSSNQKPNEHYLDCINYIN